MMISLVGAPGSREGMDNAAIMHRVCDSLRKIICIAREIFKGSATVLSFLGLELQ